MRRRKPKAGRKPAHPLLKLGKSTGRKPTPEQYAEMLHRFFEPVSRFVDEERQREQQRRQRLLESVERTPCAATAPAVTKLQAVRDLLPRLHPNGVAAHVSTKTVQQQVIVELGYEVSWDTVHRALGRPRRK
jgi:hypothetical protein